jgi:Response regulator of the LytR/AlgR family
VNRDGLVVADPGLLGLIAELRAGGGPAPATASTEHQRLVIKSDGRMFFVRPSDIGWVEASANYVRLHARGESYILRESMKHMESRLPGHAFVRIHRSAIVNLDHVRELQPWFHGEYIVILNDGTKLTASRAYAPRLRQLIG